MANHRKNPDDPKWAAIDAAKASQSEGATEREPAPATAPVTPALEPLAPVYTPPPRTKRIERQGASNVPMVRHYPQVRSGICEKCGVLDRNVPSQYQYKLCPHYRGMQLMCSYCPADKDPDDIIYHSIINVAEHPENPDQLVVWCNSFNCSEAHLKRFKVSQ